MKSESEFRAIFERARLGSEEATRELVQSCDGHILRVVRRAIDKRMRTIFDSQDFVQALWASLFAQKQNLEKFDEPEQLVAFLVVMARNMVVDEFRRRIETKKYGMTREVQLNDIVPPMGNLPSPSETAVANERWDAMNHGLSPRDQQILKLRSDGEAFAAIAEKMGVHERTVRRIIKKLADDHEQS